ncbi:M14 family metallopeptidase [Algoriphagus machipongonensis]|uniref:Secreted protein containing N- Zinc-dependent carboxypeptidase related domain protein n=1 Tax=Algoriphagus machipongonensis TaxID=388413 RepID=A3I2W4_9BACT|nr:M14 family metallopeptidase [Algoriphagus machipongonensis]EAZ79163.1 secreted protein containing N- Zinc-dependent carboxypeptidase related domain protein [Algoriphagus machipongonensis]
MKKPLTLLILGIFLSQFSFGQENYFFPGEKFDPAIPSPSDFLGYEIGEWHTRYDLIVKYFEKLDEISDMASLKTIGYTHELRPKIILTISSPSNMENLEEIRLKQLQLADPSQSKPEVSSMPAIIHQGYGVHGNEPSSAEAAMLTAYWLMASQSELATNLRENSVVHFDPTVNPDGRDRHSHWANTNKGFPPVADPLDREHNEVWPGGRTNHYWFDLNRDWLPLAHPESQAKIAWYHTWYPNVTTDFHEMGTNSTYFFEPTKPYGSENPVVPRKNYDDINVRFAKYFSKYLDEIGSLYWTKEVFDNSYPGYGSTYPDIHGGLGLVFEQASSRGHLQNSQRGEISFAFTIRNHVRSSLATMEAALDNKDFMHDYLREFFETAVSEGSDDPAGNYVFGDEYDESRNQLFVKLLLDHHIKVYENDSDIDLGNYSFKKGKSWVVPTSQPQFRMVRSMFEEVTEFADSVFYDASTWTMAHTYGMPFATSSGIKPGDEVTEVSEIGYPFPEGKAYAYLIDWADYYAPRMLNDLQKAGIHVEVINRPFTSQTTSDVVEFGAGTLMIPMGFQDLDETELLEKLKELANKNHQQVYATKTGLNLQGIDLGSNLVGAVTEPKVIMVVGDGVSSYEAGEIWYLLDSQVGMPITKVNSDDMGRVNLFDYNTLVLPSGNYNSFSEGFLDHLKDWLQRGGTIVSLKSASLWLNRAGITNEKMVERPENSDPIALPYADRNAFEGAKAVGGSIYMAKLDLTHPITYGYRRDQLPVYRNSSIFVQPSQNKYLTPIRYTEDPLLGGYISDENLELMKQSASLIISPVGRGRVINFYDSPNFRGTWFGTNKLFLNALFFGDIMD